MTPKEFFLALNGKNRHQSDIIDVYQKTIFNAIRWNASSITSGLNEKQAKAISKYEFPWEKNTVENRSKSGERKPISYDTMKTAFDLISKPKQERESESKRNE